MLPESRGISHELMSRVTRYTSHFTSVYYLLKDLNPITSTFSILKPINIYDYNEILYIYYYYYTWYKYSNYILFNNNIDYSPGNKRYDLLKGSLRRKCDDYINKG
jgi:hypothetical protein